MKIWPPPPLIKKSKFRILDFLMFFADLVDFFHFLLHFLIRRLPLYDCQFCDKIFTVRRYLDTHINRNHGDVQLQKCTQCEKVFNNLKQHLKQHLKRHIQVTHMEHKPNTCDFCGKNFSRVDNLKEHIKFIHSKVCLFFL